MVSINQCIKVFLAAKKKKIAEHSQKVLMHIRQRSLLFKLLLTVTGFICVPLIVIQLIMVGQSVKEIQKTNQETYISVLHSSAESFCSQKDVLSQIAVRVSLDESIWKPLRSNATDYSWYISATALKNYGNEVLCLEHTGLYYKTKGCVIINEVKWSFSDYCKNVITTDPVESTKLECFFAELESMDYFAIKDETRLIAARPVSMVAAGSNDAIALFIIDANALEQSFRTSISVRSSFAIVNDRGELLIQGDDFRNKISEGDLTLFLSSEEDACVAGEDGELSLYKYTDPETNYTFLLSVDTDEAEQSLVKFADRIRLTLCFALIVICVSLSVTLWINYRPIYQLLERHAPVKDNMGTHTELERLDSAFFALDERMATQSELLADFILGDLLFGNVADQNLVNRYFPAGQYRSFAVASIRLPALASSQAQALEERIEEITGYHILVTRVPYRPHIVVISLSNMIIEPIMLEDGIRQALAVELNEKCHIGVGEVVTDIYELRTSFRDSITRSIPDSEGTSLNDNLFAMMSKHFVQCVCVGDETEALSYLDEINQFMLTELSDESLRRYYCYKLIDVYLSGINSSGLHQSAADGELLLSFSSPQHLYDMLRYTAKKVCQQVRDAERSSEQQLQKKLLRYVDDNFRNCELCLMAAADYLDTSIYVVSRLFKEIAGRGFKDYVTEKRLEYGHTLLCTTSGSIAEISAASGFENANYFSAVFKLKYGLPPTKYRKMLEDNQRAN